MPSTRDRLKARKLEAETASETPQKPNLTLLIISIVAAIIAILVALWLCHR